MSKRTIGGRRDRGLHGCLRDPVARPGTSGRQLANCSWHRRTVLEVTDESRQARLLPGGEIEQSLFVRSSFSKTKS
jgi:hypothetical protein